MMRNRFVLAVLLSFSCMLIVGYGTHPVRTLTQLPDILVDKYANPVPVNVVLKKPYILLYFSKERQAASKKMDELMRSFDYNRNELFSLVFISLEKDELEVANHMNNHDLPFYGLDNSHVFAGPILRSFDVDAVPRLVVWVRGERWWMRMARRWC